MTSADPDRPAPEPPDDPGREETGPWPKFSNFSDDTDEQGDGDSGEGHDGDNGDDDGSGGGDEAAE
jgi:hypothetical protein